MPKGIALLGSTGSIGRQALAVIDCYPERFKIISLTAGRNIELLEQQMLKFKPKVVVVGDQERGNYLKNKLTNYPVEIYAGQEFLDQGVIHPEVEMVISALSGVAGLLPTLKAIEAGKDIALANKETLVAAGDLVTNTAKKYNIRLLPVDSEHSAIFQCLQGNRAEDVQKLILTASGGPFKNFTFEELEKVTVEQALKHPNWEMGAKITIDSATLMNKGLEVIEAKHLFNISYEQIKVLIHPQSIIHSMVEYRDGSIMAQLGLPNMQVPIQYALTHPERWEGSFQERLNLVELSELTFENPNNRLFPALELAYSAGKIGGTMPAVLNGANEVAVQGFLEKKIKFLQIAEIVEKVMNQHQVIKNPELEEILNADWEARQRATSVFD